MNFNFSRPRARTPATETPPSRQQPRPQPQPQSPSPLQPPSPLSARPSHIRLSSIAESITAASAGPQPDLAQHPAFSRDEDPPSSPRLAQTPSATPTERARVAGWTPPWSPNPASSRFSANTSTNGSAGNSSSSDQASRESPPPAYTPRLSRGRRKRHVPIGTAIGAPTLTKDGVQKEYYDDDDDDDNGRGRWKFIVVGVVAACVVVGVALGVGLGVGLSVGKSKSNTSNNNNNNNNNINDPPAVVVSPPQSFPIGKWSLATYLTNVSSSCTANAATWTCYPYSTYTSGGATSSAATLDWIITSSSTTASNTTLLISTSPNPFSLSFTNVSLTLHDQNTQNERYTFSTPLTKQVWPTVDLTADNARDTCFYNNTILAATLYTRVLPTLLPVTDGNNNNNASTVATGYTAWPGAVLVEQTSAGGASVPDCYRTVNGVVSGGSVSAQAGLVAQAVGRVCSCVYENAGLEGAA